MTDTIGLAQVGVGYWGKNLLRNFSQLEGTKVHTVYDQREEALDLVRRQYSSISISASLDALLSHPDIDAVVVATETPQHFPIALAALEAGKHVFVEKPMTQHLDEAERLVELAESKGLQLMVGHLLLYHPAYRFVVEAATKGDLGDVYYLYSVRANLGIVRQTENVLESLAPHDISVALEIMSQPPAAVSALGSAYLQESIEDVCFMTIFFEGGQLAHLHLSWLDPNKIRRLTVVGSKQMAVVDDQEGTEKVRLYDREVAIEPSRAKYADYAGSISVRSGDIIIPHVKMQEPLTLECRHFLECIRSGETPRTGGRNGLDVMRVLLAAQRSLKSGGDTVTL